jgi:hypothetical protein
VFAPVVRCARAIVAIIVRRTGRATAWKHLETKVVIARQCMATRSFYGRLRLLFVSCAFGDGGYGGSQKFIRTPPYIVIGVPGLAVRVSLMPPGMFGHGTSPIGPNDP